MNTPPKFYSNAKLLLPLIIMMAGAELSQAADTLTYTANASQMRSLSSNGQNLLTGNGVYIIGSRTGEDIPENNYISAGNTDGVMRAAASSIQGPRFSLTFSRKDSNTLRYRAAVTTMPFDMKTLSVPFDFSKSTVTAFAFNGSSYRDECRGATINKSSDSYASVLQCHTVRDKAGNILGKVGVATIGSSISWGQVQGSFGKLRVTVTASSHYRKMHFYHHFGTNNLELSFGAMKKGETGFVEGEIILTPASSSGGSWTFEAESELSHQIGRKEADGWSVRVGDTPKRYMCFGPYTTVVSTGARTATFRLLLDNNTADNLRILTLDAYDANSGRVLASKDISRKQFLGAQRFQDFELPFVASSGQRLEFRTFWHGASYVRQDRVTVR